MKSVTGGLKYSLRTKTVQFGLYLLPLLLIYYLSFLTRVAPEASGIIDFSTFPTITRDWMVLVVSSCSDPNSLHFISSLCSVLKGGINYFVPGMGQGKRVGLSLVSFRYNNILYLRQFTKIICN